MVPYFYQTQGRRNLMWLYYFLKSTILIFAGLTCLYFLALPQYDCVRAYLSSVSIISEKGRSNSDFGGLYISNQWPLVLIKVGWLLYRTVRNPTLRMLRVALVQYSMMLIQQKQRLGRQFLNAATGKDQAMYNTMLKLKAQLRYHR